jgi:hypothetical protein
MNIQEQVTLAVNAKMEKWRGAKLKTNPHGFITIAEESDMRRRLEEMEAAERGLPLSGITPPPEPAQTLKTFWDRDFPRKDSLIESLLYRRDIVAFAGRRRHGKTTFITNLVLSLILKSDFLGYGIPSSVRVLVLYLEDDAEELQIRLKQMIKAELSNEQQDKLALYPREDFYRAKIPIDAKHPKFRRFVIEKCAVHKPDVIIFDNLAHLIGADYNNSKLIHALMQFVWELTNIFNAGVIIAAHPRKRDKKTDSMGFNSAVRLRDDPEGFFEEVMGSSHFVNSCGSLWGIERDLNTDRTDFLGGAQRFTGKHSMMTLEKDDDGWLRRVSDFDANLTLALNTPRRRKAWELLPEGTFSYTQAESAVKPEFKSKSSFYDWFEHCKRLGVITAENEVYRKAFKEAASAHQGSARGKQ